jgi:predicted HTH domain antitoxin
MMTEKHVEEQLAALARRVAELEARLAELESPRALREAEPVYRIDRNEMNEGVVVPEKVLRASGLSQQELLVELAVHLFEEDFISLGVAKSLAGMSTAQFMKLLGSRNIPLHYDVEELEEDVKTLKQLGLL